MRCILSPSLYSPRLYTLRAQPTKPGSVGNDSAGMWLGDANRGTFEGVVGRGNGVTAELILDRPRVRPLIRF